MRKFVTWTAIKNEYGTGSWSLDGDLLTVVTQHGWKVMQLGSMPVEFLATRLMREIAA
jgi:hypothetical protein